MSAALISRRRMGFSITELMIACAILALGLGVIYDQFARTAGPSQRYTHRVQARMLAEKQLAELCASSADSIATFKPSAQFQQIEADSPFYLKAEVNVPPQGAANVTVQVGWNPTGEADSISFPAGQIMTAKGTRSR